MYVTNSWTAIICALGLLLAAGCANEYGDDDDEADDDVADDDTAGDDDTIEDDDSSGDDDTSSGNHPPTTPQIHVEPEEPFTEDPLYCVVDVPSTDPDNDPVAYSYDWDIDGVPSGMTGDTIPANATSDMEEWTCRVRAFDGEDFSDSVTDTVLVGPAAPGGYYFGASFSATGGAGPGVASAEIEWIMVDDPTGTPVELCTYTYDFTGTYAAVMPEHGDDYYEYIDLVMDYSAGNLSNSGCPAAWDDIYAATTSVMDWFEWFMDPTAILTCDLIAADAGLAATYLMDDFVGAGTDGTLGGWCEDYGALVAASGYVIEGVWVRPMDSSAGDYGVGLAYFPAPNGDIGGLGYFDAWAFFGFVYADTTNTFEPSLGIEGDYISDIFWVWTVTA